MRATDETHPERWGVGAGTAPRLSVITRASLFGGLAAAVLAFWISLAAMIGDMSAMPAMASTMPVDTLSLGHLGWLFVMWVIMQAAMMLPTAVPMTFAFARMRAAGRDGAHLAVPVTLFCGGYLAAWAGFGAAAAVLQALLASAALLSPMSMALASGPLAGGVLIAAGLYQWLPWKDACLSRCRTPIGFLMTEWRDGRAGAFVMGWRHGLFCVGCCWALMCLLFTAGVMNAFWIAAISLYVLLEKVVPYGEILTRLAGAGLIGTGVWLIR